MPLQLSQVELSQAYQGSIANRAVEKSLAKISTGKKLLDASEDSAAYAQSLRMESQQKRDSNNLNNLQNLMVIDFKGTELLIPFVENYIESIDNKKKEIHLQTPDGLIDLYL